MRMLTAINAVLLFGILPHWKCSSWLSGKPPDIVPERENNTAAMLGKTPKTEVLPPRVEKTPREEMAPPEQRPAKIVPEVPPVALPDQVVVHALDATQSAFMSCFHFAQKRDPTLISLKINMHIYVEPMGTVMSAHSDVTDPRLDACLVRVASRMKFPAPNALAVADMTFFAW